MVQLTRKGIVFDAVYSTAGDTITVSLASHQKSARLGLSAGNPEPLAKALLDEIITESGMIPKPKA